ncbi:MAG: hypothetical protein GY828_03325 [Candidatus Gracilibacteria bacterium]|nr:hypothetical protein [Candidatus Gracilibacteria bacterium]
MGEIFIPEKLFGKIEITKLQDNFLALLGKHFEISEVSIFQTPLCTGQYFKVNRLNQDILSVLNGEVGTRYFIDYDHIEGAYEVAGSSILKPSDMSENIVKISKEFEEITAQLSGDGLMTFSKKQEIKNKIENTFFTLSGILFLLYHLKNKSHQNSQELGEYDGVEEFEGQAKLLNETSKTKRVELDAQIQKFESMSEVFFKTIEKIFL